MITGNLNLDIAHDMGRYHMLYPERRTTITIPLIPTNSAGVNNRKLAAALAMVYTACQCLTIHYQGKSGNQLKKAQRLKAMAWRQMKIVSEKLHDFDIMQIGAKIDTLNTRLGFDDQPSWMVYISFCIAILSDVFPDLKKTRLSGKKTELETIMASLQDLHDYMTKKEGKQAQVYDKKACDLYSLWAELF
jgi:hypothetical protein